MNLILLDPDELGPVARDPGARDPSALDPSGCVRAEVILSGRRAAHIQGVIRPPLGATLRVAVVRGPRGTGRVVALSDSQVRLEVTLSGPAAPRPPVDLLLAVPRPKVLGRVLRAAAAFGVGRIDLANAWRVERSYLSSPALAPDRLEAALRQGAEQGATAWVPEVALHPRLMPYLDEILPSRDAGETRLLLHPAAERPLEAARPPGSAGRVLAALGPEGGWIAREVETFERLGFSAVHLGAAVLDVAPAVSSLLGQLDLLGRLPKENKP